MGPLAGLIDLTTLNLDYLQNVTDLGLLAGLTHIPGLTVRWRGPRAANG